MSAIKFAPENFLSDPFSWKLYLDRRKSVVTLAQYRALTADNNKVTADQAQLTADATTQTTDEASFAAGLDGPKAFLSEDGTSVDIVTPAPAAPGFTVQTVVLVTS